MLVKAGGLQAQAVSGDGLYMLGPRDQHDLMPSAREHGAVITAYSARAHDGDLEVFVCGGVSERDAGHGGTPGGGTGLAF